MLFKHDDEVFKDFNDLCQQGQIWLNDLEKTLFEKASGILGMQRAAPEIKEACKVIVAHYKEHFEAQEALVRKYHHDFDRFGYLYTLIKEVS